MAKPKKMRLFVPNIGDQLTLAADWTFTLHPEDRNNTFWKRAELPAYRTTWGQVVGDKEGTTDPICSVIAGPNATVFLQDPKGNQFSPEVTLPKGTVLKCSRVYIRNGGQDMKDFASLTWSIVKCPQKKLKGRFWVKLADANTMVIETP